MHLSRATGADGKRRCAQRVLVVFAVTLTALLYLDRVCISQSQPLIACDLGLTKKQMGLVMTVFGSRL